MTVVIGTEKLTKSYGPGPRRRGLDRRVPAVAGPILTNFKTLVPAFSGVAQVTPWAWTADHLPLAGQEDWGSLAPVVEVAAVLIPLGIEAFARRDLGHRPPSGRRACPRSPWGCAARSDAP